MNFKKPRTRSKRNSINFMAHTEKWRQYNRRISRRDDYYEEVSDEDVTKPYELDDWEEEFFGRKRLSSNISDQDIEVQLTRKQTIILATLVPDELLLMNKFNSAEPKRFVGVLLMADVSGYTALSERYNSTGKGGTYRLTVTLNTYLGSLIELIYNHGGDVLKFAGDAFLALWKTDKHSFLCHTIHTVIACALIIQHSYSSYETDVKVNLRVKLAISAGNLIFAPIGTGIDMNYVITGLPVIEAKVAESVCGSGEVKLTPTAWGHCYSRNYDHIVHDNGHVTIKSILYDPHEKDVTKPFLGFGAMIRNIKKPFSTIENFPDHLWDLPQNLSAIDTLKKAEALSLRKAILVAEDKNIGSELRKFMIRPVLTQIDAHQPLEYLTEMRQVSVVFITLKPKECPFMQLITIVNNSYKITCEIVYKSMGCVNKIILFDKDVMMLVIFGLRGFKHESEAQAALKCAYSIKKSVSALDGVEEVSIGVTTGQVYCGVVGHPLRREFTIIGAVVNKAARLMCSFHNKITCDELTFVKSKMSTNGFILQSKIELKGITHPGKIYEYTEEIRVKELYDIPMIPPLLNRSDEMEYFSNWLDDCHSSYRDFDALLLIGESRIGKSKLLEWMARYTKSQNFKICYINLTSIHSATPYLALSQIMNQMLGLTEPITGFAKEEKIVELLKLYSEDLCYLNNIIKVRFAYHENIYSLDEQKRKDKAKFIFTKLISSLTETYVIFLDDLQSLDPNSWEFVTLMLNVMKIFTILTITRGKFSSIHNWLYSVFINSSIRKIVLGPLPSDWIAPLACQILDVDAVPNDLCNTLKSKCKGIPGLIESFIVHLFSSGALEIKKIRDSELENWKNEELQLPDPLLLHPQAVDVKEQETLDKLLETNSTGEIGICIITQKELLNTNINNQNADALIMIQMDSLTPYQQLLLKIASVIGSVLSRDLLENIMYENNPITTAKAVKRLFSMRILMCANVKSKWSRSLTSTVTLASKYSTYANLVCDCNFEYDPENNENLPKYAFCKVMKFRNKNSRKTCYELLPINQKKEFHTRIVNYLENSKQKCSECGGTITVVQSVINIVPEKTNYNRFDFNSIKESSDDSDISNSFEEVEVPSQVNNKDSSNEFHNSHQAQSESFITTTTEYDITSKNLSRSNSLQSIPSNKSNIFYTPILKSKQEDDLKLSRPSTKRVTMTSLLYKNIDSDIIENSKVFNMLRDITEAENISDWHNLGIIDSDDDRISEKLDRQRKSFSIKIEKNVSKTNFFKCTCAELNITIYEQLIHHAVQAELKVKLIEFLIKYSYLNLLSTNVDNALPKLAEAEQYCKEKNSNIVLNTLDKQRYLGKIYSLKAAALMLDGKLNAAKLEMDHATRIYRINLLTASNIFKVKNIVKAVKIKRKYRIHEAVMTSDSIFCLNVATSLYSALGDQKTSRISALKALELIQRVECNVIDMCDAFTNAMHVELQRGIPESTAIIERSASNAIRHLQQPIQANELYALGKLFMITFRARIARGVLAASIRSGFRAIVVSNFLHAEDISIDIIPDLFYILLARCRIEEAIDVIQESIRLNKNSISLDCESWYYALCIDLILDTGLQLEPPQDISRYAERTLHKGKLGGPSRRRLVVGLWTYWLRTNLEHKARRFESEALNWAAREDDEGSLTTLISALRLAEGMLESLTRKVNDLRKVVDLMELRSLADRELTRIEEDARLNRTIYCRWLLLKSNSLSLSGRHSAAAVTLNQAFEEARRIHNRLEEAAARAVTNGNSSYWVQSARSGSFMNWREGIEHARGSWHQLLHKITTTR